MKIIFAKNIGFCFGVKRALSILEKSLKEDPKPVQLLGSLIHNEKVIEEIIKKGGKFIKDISEVSSGTLVLRAHGVPTNILKGIKRNIVVRETTCPLVKKAQMAANFFYKKGYKVIIIGNKEHPETKAIKSYTDDTALVIENEKEAKNLPKNFQEIGVVAQTTQEPEKIKRILKILKTKCKKINWKNTICPEVSNRQKELREILKKVEGIIIVGSHSSANTSRLAEIAKNSGKPFWWINSVKELKKEEFRKLSSVGVVSGTSAPNWEIEKIKKWLINLN